MATHTSDGAAVDQAERLGALLTVSPTGPGTFSGPADPLGPARVFGGHAIAQALAAAAESVSDELSVHVLQSSFVRSADGTRPLDLGLDQSGSARDGGNGDSRSFARRTVSAMQGERRLLDVLASFHKPEPGPEYQEQDASGLPGPEALPSLESAAQDFDDATRDWCLRFASWLPFELRFATEPCRARIARDGRTAPHQSFWLRARPLGDDPVRHACAAAYASDAFLLSTALSPHGLRYDDAGVFSVTLNHSMWFHRVFRMDQWVRYDQESSWTGGGRALCRGRFVDRSGALLATMAQEGLLRVRTPSSNPMNVPDLT